MLHHNAKNKTVDISKLTGWLEMREAMWGSHLTRSAAEVILEAAELTSEALVTRIVVCVTGFCFSKLCGCFGWKGKNYVKSFEIIGLVTEADFRGSSNKFQKKLWLNQLLFHTKSMKEAILPGGKFFQPACCIARPWFLSNFGTL